MNIFLYIFLINLVISPIIILFLSKFGFYKKKDTTRQIESKRNEKYYKHLLSNMSTPSSFGVLLLINLLMSFFFFKIIDEATYLVITSLLLGLLGFADDVYQFFYYKAVGHWGFKARYKMAIQLIVTFILFFLVTDSLLYSSVVSVFATFILNSFNITDGLDGLAGGIAIPPLLFFAYLEYLNYGASSILNITLLITVFLIVFLVFNIKPAKVFLGDSGSYAIGTILAFLTFRYNLFYTVPVISLFLIEGLSSLIQILCLKLLKKRVFKIAPLHLHLLNSGWSQWKVIATAWVTQIVITLIVFITYIYVK